jgi:hypothetical protein
MSIDKLISTIGKRGGLAKQNRFQVIFTPPQGGLLSGAGIIGALTSGGGLKSLINDPRDISMLCENVTLPGRQIATLDYIAEKQSVKVPYSFINEDVTCTFLLTNDYYMKTMFDGWLEQVFDDQKYNAKFKKDFTSDVVIQQLNNKDVPIYGVRLENAFPTTVAGITLDNNSESAVQKLTVTFSYDNYVPEGPLSSTMSALRSAIPSGLI